MIHPLSLVTKRESSFVYESSLFVRRRASIGINQLGGECFERCSEVLMYLFSLQVPGSCDHFYIYCTL